MNAHTLRAIEDLPTPALVLDLDVLERNLDAMQTRADRLGVRLRPHAKTHKCVQIAELQRSRGARGLTVSTLEEARIFASHGFDDVTWAFPVIGGRLGEVAEIAAEIDLGVTVDSGWAIERLPSLDRPLSVWLEIDTGYGRTGVRYDDPAALDLARQIAARDDLALRGLLTHAGHTYHAGTPDRIREIAETERSAMVELADRFRADGLDPGTLSVGSTPGMSLVETLEGVDEARPGNYALYDYTQASLGACTPADCAVSVIGTVISARAGEDRCVADCGALVVSKDLGPDDPPHFGRVWADLSATALDPGIRIASVSQEHAILSGYRPMGSKVRVLPNHACLTVARFDHFFVARGYEVVDRWKIWRARGPFGTGPRVA